MKSSTANRLAIALLLFGTIAVVATADTHNWIGATSNKWNVSTNWEIVGGVGNAVPADGDSAIIDDTSPQSTVQYDVTTANYGMVNILLGDGMSLELLSTNTLELDDTLTVEGNATIKGTGTFDGVSTGKLRIDGGVTGATLTKAGSSEVYIGPTAPSP